MIKAGIFDIGGVLNKSVHRYVENDVKETFQLSEAVFRKIWNELEPLFAKGKIDEAEFWKRFVKKSNTKIPLPKESLWIRSRNKHIQPHHEVREIVKNLKQNGYITAILSNTIIPHSESNRASGLFNLFDYVFLSHEMGLIKPDPKIYQAALEKLKVKAHEAFFVDDKIENILAAEKLGIHGIHFKNDPKALLEHIRKLGIPV